MHRLNLRLNRLTKGLIPPIPVIVDDVTSILSGGGSMVATFPNGEISPPLIWEQVSGTPVTFTSPLNEPIVTFTSNDLLSKEFKCTTNPDDPIAARYDTGKFLSYPLDTEEVSMVAPLDSILIKAASFNVRITPGVGNYILGQSNVNVYEPTNEWTSFKIIAEGKILKISFYTKVGSVWTLLEERTGSNVYPYFDSTNANEVKFTVKQIILGHITEEDIIVNNVTSYTNRTAGYQDSTQLSSMAPLDSALIGSSIVLQTLNKVSVQDTNNVNSVPPLDSIVANMDIHLQSLLTYTGNAKQDSIYLNISVPLDSVNTNYTYTLSNYIGVI